MKEVLTKNFWRSVKKTFYDALDGPSAEDTDLSSLLAPSIPITSEQSVQRRLCKSL
jgi:hypothetical protein